MSDDKLNERLKSFRRSGMKITAIVDQTREILDSHIVSLMAQDRDWMEEFRDIAGKPTDQLDPAEVGVLKTFAVFGAQSMLLSKVKSEIDAMEIAKSMRDGTYGD